MAKTITLNYKGTEYTLEFTRKAVVRLENKGFNIEDVGAKPMSTLPLLFEGAFFAHHRPLIGSDIIDELYKQIPDKTEFLAKLAEMYAEPIEALMEEPEEGNLTWGASW